MTRCTLVLEFNYGAPRSNLGSVWLFGGDGRADLEREEGIAKLPGWCKLVGPIDYEMAASIHRELLAFLRSSGVEVFDEGIAD